MQAEVTLEHRSGRPAMTKHVGRAAAAAAIVVGLEEEEGYPALRMGYVVTSLRWMHGVGLTLIRLRRSRRVDP